MSLRFPKELRARVSRYAKARGLEEATAVRVLCMERLQELELTDALALAERWQTTEALKSWEQLERGELRSVPADLAGLFADARKRAR
ncbi:MAG: hypothetical protein JNK82_40035 [Myxococcaceae bacterium]|nr:hypothetical protein [Myxococcaceae bacterium]